MKTSETTAAIFAALAAAQGEMENPKRTSTANAGTYTYTYAALDAILDAARDPLKHHGLALTQEDLSSPEYGAGVTTLLVHESGEWIEYGPLWVPTKADAQGIGGGLSYARRYAATAALGLATEEDDDGRTAQGGTTRDRTPKATDNAMKRLHALARTKGITHEQMRDWAGRNLGIESLTELSRAGAAEMEASLKGLPDAPEGTEGAMTDA